MKPELIAALKYAAACQHLTASNLADAYAIQTAAMADEMDRLRAALERLREYARHQGDCEQFNQGDITKLRCNCGYDELMKELEETK